MSFRGDYIDKNSLKYLKVFKTLTVLSNSGLPAFFDDNMYKQSVHCTQSCVKRWEFSTPCFNFFVVANLYIIVPYGVHFCSPDQT